MIAMSNALSATASSTATRPDGRSPNALRTVTFQNDIAPHATGSTLISFGNTKVICAVTVDEGVPRWMKEQGVTGRAQKTQLDAVAAQIILQAYFDQQQTQKT